MEVRGESSVQAVLVSSASGGIRIRNSDGVCANYTPERYWPFANTDSTVRGVLNWTNQQVFQLWAPAVGVRCYLSRNAGVADQADRRGNCKSRQRELAVRLFQPRDKWEWTMKGASSSEMIPTGGQGTHSFYDGRADLPLR